MGFNDLQPFIDHGCRINRDFGPHAPVRMAKRILHCNILQLITGVIPERAARGGKCDAGNIFTVLTVQALKNSRVLAVNRQQLNSFASRKLCYQMTGCNQRFFVGQADMPARLNSRQRRLKANAAHNRRYNRMGVSASSDFN
ncbi:hypothetical protein D3C81_1615850 [compost metagenome]